MEKLYRKVGRKYVEWGFGSVPEITDGIWLCQTKPGSKSMASLVWKVGNLERPVDIVTHAALQTLEEDLAKYLINLGKSDSKEFIEAKEIAGGYLKEPIGYYNVSAGQLCSLFLRRIALYLEDGELLDWDMLQHKFRKETGLHLKPEFEQGVSVLYKFTDWLKKNNIKFRQGKNIG
jgi:hypothetical protein